MNDHTAQLLIDRLSAGFPEPGTTPIPELLRDGRRTRSRRRRTTVGAVALAVAFVVAGVALVPRLGSDSPDPAPTNEMPAPPAGLRWVGYGQDVLAVPESWSTGDAPCNVPQSDTVYVALPDVALFCAAPSELPGLSHVAIHPATSGPSFVIESPDSDLEDLIANSRRTVPDGWTTVPWPVPLTPAKFQELLVEQGFDVEVVEHFQDGIDGARVTTDPAFGTPLREGSTIRVLVPTLGPPCGDDCGLMEIDPDLATPGQVVQLFFPHETMRGIGFRLDQRVGNDRWEYRFSLIAPIGTGEPSWVPPGQSAVIEDIGVGGSGPDRLVIPPPTKPGSYRICTTNARQEMCDMVTIAE